MCHYYYCALQTVLLYVFFNNVKTNKCNSNKFKTLCDIVLINNISYTNGSAHDVDEDVGPVPSPVVILMNTALVSRYLRVVFTHSIDIRRLVYSAGVK